MHKKDEPCVFCRILDGEAPGTIVFRDESCTAFLDLIPINPGHVLVVPNDHAVYLEDLEADQAGHLMRIGHRIAAAIRASELKSEGVNLFLADGSAAGQEVFHVHLHVIPRFKGDSFGLRFGSDRKEKPRAELDATGALLAQHLD